MSVVSAILDCYPAPLRGPITPLGNHDGFSGAMLFRVQSPAGDHCLRAWPRDSDAAQLDRVHALMRCAAEAGLEFVPRVLPSLQGDNTVAWAGQWWEVAIWMPGAASLCSDPTPQRVCAASTALARLHRAWAEPHARTAAPPAVARRLAAARDWLPLIAAGWRPPEDSNDPITLPARAAWTVLRRRLPLLASELAPWLARPMPLQPCLCDARPEHFLFTGDRVTGLVDFGSCKLDHVSVDLARLLGGHRAFWSLGLDAYDEERPLTAEERALAGDLERSGVVIAAANWLRWVYREGRTYPDRDRVARRLAGLVERLE
jgi:homoserine kinase type II